MSLRRLAEADLGLILEDDKTGFGWSITVTDPSGNTNNDDLLGYSDDISQIIDPDTGQVVSGRMASVAIRITRLTQVGLAIPQGIVDAGIKPWIVEFKDINNNAHKFKVNQSNPDRMLGLVSLMLELYE